MSKKDVQGSDTETTVQEDLERLSLLMAWFQGDEFTLEQAAMRYAEAEALAEVIEKKLDGLKNDISVIRQRFEDVS